MIFREHQGQIIISNSSLTFISDLDFFLTLESGYTPVANEVLDPRANGQYLSRIYVPGKRHFLFDGVSQFQGAANLINRWALGDVYISKVAEYIAAQEAANAPTPLTDAEKKNIKQEEVKSEAERRIATGLVISGIAQFRTDDGSITRLHALLTGAQLRESLSLPVNTTFRTSAGAEINITSAAQVAPVYLAAVDYVAAVLEISSTMQGDVENMTPQEVENFDESLDSLWPTYS